MKRKDSKKENEINLFAASKARESNWMMKEKDSYLYAAFIDVEPDWKKFC